MLPRRTASDQPGRPFWVEISCSAFFFTGGGAADSEFNGYVHEAEYIINIKPIMGGPQRAVAAASSESLNDPAVSDDDSASDASDFGRQFIPSVDLLNESILYNFEFPLIALSR